MRACTVFPSSIYDIKGASDGEAHRSMEDQPGRHPDLPGRCPVLSRRHPNPWSQDIPGHRPNADVCLLVPHTGTGPNPGVPV